MGIDFKINITKKIKINGKEYGSLDEVPAQHRQTVQDALGMAESGTAGKININGTAYDSPEAMPPDARRTYEEALAKARTMAEGKGLGLDLPGSNKFFTVKLNSNPQAGAPVQEGGLSLRTLAILILIAALAALAIFFSPK